MSKMGQYYFELEEKHFNDKCDGRDKCIFCKREIESFYQLTYEESHESVSNF
jgi:hypothetical protein